MKKIVNEKEKVEIVKALIGGETQRSVMERYGYSSTSSISRILSVASAMIKDYSKTHTLAETLKNYEHFGLTAEWLNNNKIQCAERKPLNENAIVRNYGYGMTISECCTTYGATEDEIREILSRNNIPIEEDKLPDLQTGDIVWIKNGKMTNERDLFTNIPNRPALVITPQFQLTKGVKNIVVIFGTSHEPDAPKWTYFRTNKYYTGKETYYNFLNTTSVSINEILPPNEKKFPHLNSSDYSVLRTMVGGYFGGKFYNPNYSNNDDAESITDDELNSFIVSLFENGLNRNQIYDVISDTVYDCDKAFIQSVLDKAGYDGVKSVIEEKEEPQVEYVTTTDAELAKNINDLTIENVKLNAELSVYKKFFEKVGTINV